MTKTPHPSTAALWARFRFSVVGSLLSSPPARGELKAAIQSLAAKTWTHPINGRDVRFAAGSPTKQRGTQRGQTERSTTEDTEPTEKETQSPLLLCALCVLCGE